MRTWGERSWEGYITDQHGLFQPDLKHMHREWSALIYDKDSEAVLGLSRCLRFFRLFTTRAKYIMQQTTAIARLFRVFCLSTCRNRSHLRIKRPFWYYYDYIVKWWRLGDSSSHEYPRQCRSFLKMYSK